MTFLSQTQAYFCRSSPSQWSKASQTSILIAVAHLSTAEEAADLFHAALEAHYRAYPLGVRRAVLPLALVSFEQAEAAQRESQGGREAVLAAVP